MKKINSLLLNIGFISSILLLIISSAVKAGGTSSCELEITYCLYSDMDKITVYIYQGDDSAHVLAEEEVQLSRSGERNATLSCNDDTSCDVRARFITDISKIYEYNCGEEVRIRYEDYKFEFSTSWCM